MIGIGPGYPRVFLISAITTSNGSNDKCRHRRAGRKWKEAARDWRILVGTRAESVGERASGKAATGAGSVCGSGPTMTLITQIARHPLSSLVQSKVYIVE
jgi:hypothetical protein